MTKCYMPYIPLSDLISIIYLSKATPATSQFLKQIRHSPTSLLPYALPAMSEMLFPQLSIWLALSPPSHFLLRSFLLHSSILTTVFKTVNLDDISVGI